MKIKEIFLVFLFIAASTSAQWLSSTKAVAPSNYQYTKPNSVNLDSIIRYWMEVEHLPGLQACAVKNGQVIWHGAYGYARLRDSLPATDTIRFGIQCISKLVTSTALMQVWENGLFDLDDNVNNLLPFQVINPHFQDDSITSRMLLAHTSSIIDNWALLDTFLILGDTSITLEECCREFLIPGGVWYSDNNYSYWYPPGQWFNYSHMGSTLFGYLVEAITGNPYNYFCVHCRDSIFEPLGMTRTCWLMCDLDTNQLAMPYEWLGNQYRPLGYWSFPVFPCASVKSTALEMSRFLIAFMQYGRYETTRILDSTTVELMTTVQFPMVSPFYGLGWTWDYLGGRTVWGHQGGSALGGNCTMWWCKAETSGVIVLTNVDNGSRTGVLAIADALFDYAQTPGIVDNETSLLNTRPFLPSIVRGTLNLQSEISNLQSEIILLDITGRKVADLKSGANNIQHLTPSVYFIKSKNNQVLKIIVTK